jgi:RHS repeat-associated protein
MNEPSVYVQYLYDAGGQRVKKLTRKQGGQVEMTLYIDGVFEYQRVVKASSVKENNTLHVMDNKSRIALVRVGNPFTKDTTPAVRYHLGDHLGSSNLVIDDSANWVNREEYTPYGVTSAGSFAWKRYRFSGKEWDEESGLCYFGFRYYSPWLGRWMSSDPAGLVDGANLYQYCQSNPIAKCDPKGSDSVELTETEPGVYGTIDMSVTARRTETALQITPADENQSEITMFAEGDTITVKPPWSVQVPGTAKYSYSIQKPQLSDEEMVQIAQQRAFGDMQLRHLALMRGYQAYEDFKAKAVVEMSMFVSTELLTAGAGGLWLLGGRGLSLESKIAKGAEGASSAVQHSTAALGSAGGAEGAGGVAVGGGVGVGTHNPGTMRIVRTIQYGEKWDDLVKEVERLHYGSWGDEHAIVKLATGERAIVAGNSFGIYGMEGNVSKVFLHVHPYHVPAMPGPSPLDLMFIRGLGQRSSYLMEPRYGRFYRFSTIAN